MECRSAQRREPRQHIGEIVERPDLIFLKDAPTEPRDQGALYLTHPVVQALYPPQRRVALPTRYTMCGGPALVAALDYLADAMSRLAAAP